MSFCFLYNVVLENHCAENSPLGGSIASSRSNNSRNQSPINASYKISKSSHSGENVDFIDFTFFSIGGRLGFSTIMNFIVLNP